MTETPDAMTAETSRGSVRRPWLPACLATHGLTTDTVAGLYYLVVEEMVEDITTLTLSPWPAADGHGRLRFDDTSIAEIAVPTATLHAQLYRSWLNRRPRIGDVFGAHIDRAVLAEATEGVWDGPLGRLLTKGVHDLSTEARKVAKLAVYAVRSDILEQSQAQANRQDAKVVRNDRPAPYRADLVGRDQETTP
jgi:hypothetical protein